MSGAPVKKLPASPRVGSPSVPVSDRGGEKVNVGFGDFGAGSSNQLRDPRARRSARNNREFSLGKRFQRLCFTAGKGKSVSRSCSFVAELLSLRKAAWSICGCWLGKIRLLMPCCGISVLLRRCLAPGPGDPSDSSARNLSFRRAACRLHLSHPSLPRSTPGFTNFSRLYRLLQNFDELGDCRVYLGLFFPNREQFELTLKFS